MMQFNLLPFRVQQRRRRLQYFFCALLLSMLLGGALSGIGWQAIRTRQHFQQMRNDWLQESADVLEQEIKHGARLRVNIDALLADIANIENWRRRRNRPVDMLATLAAQIPPQAYLKKMRLQDHAITLDGIATSNRAVTEFLQNLNEQKDHIASAQLLETRAENRSSNESPTLSFSIALNLR